MPHLTTNDTNERERATLAYLLPIKLTTFFPFSFLSFFFLAEIKTIGNARLIRTIPIVRLILFFFFNRFSMRAYARIILGLTPSFLPNMNCGKKGRKEGRKGRKKGKRVGNGQRQPADGTRLAGSRVLEREEENLEKSCSRVKPESRDNPR